MTIYVNGRQTSMEVDSGSSVSTMPYKTFKRLLPDFNNIEVPDITLIAANGDRIRPKGFAEVEVNAKNGSKKLLRLYITKENNFPSLIGREWIRKLGVTIKEGSVAINKVMEANSSVSQLMKKYDNVTKPGIGLLPENFAITINLKTSPRPFYVKPRIVPYALREKAEKALNAWVEQGILKPIMHSQWAHPVVYRQKADGTVRICADFKAGLNQQVFIEDYPLPRITEIFDKLGGASIYSKLDLSQAYMHQPVKEESQGMLVINTHKGLFMFTRMPMGYSGSASHWQKTMDTILANIPGVLGYQDDIIIGTRDEKDHLKTLEEVFKRLHQHDLRLNEKKCKFFQSSVQFCGFNYSGKGIEKCPDKVKAVVKAPTPKNTAEVRSFLGLVQFYSAFLPKLAETAKPMYELLKTGKKFKWCENCKKAFQEIKNLISSDQVLVAYDQTKPLTDPCYRRLTMWNLCSAIPQVP